MPHVTIRMIEGRGEALKQKLAEEIQKTIRDTLDLEDKYISVSIEDYASADWGAVHQAEIVDKPEMLYIPPKY